MSHTVIDLLLVVVTLALAISLYVNAKQFFTRKDLEDAIKELQRRLIGPGGHITDSVENTIRQFDSVLESYRDSLGHQDVLEKTALRNLGEDLRVLSKIGGYGRATGWAQALPVIASIRVRMIVGKFALANSIAVSEQVREKMHALLKSSRSFSGLQGFYYDFYEGHLLDARPALEDQNRWPEISLAEMESASTEKEAAELMELLGEHE